LISRTEFGGPVCGVRESGIPINEHRHWAGAPKAVTRLLPVLLMTNSRPQWRRRVCLQWFPLVWLVLAIDFD
jgi:hypothetical protein